MIQKLGGKKKGKLKPKENRRKEIKIKEEIENQKREHVQNQKWLLEKFFFEI